MWAEVEISSGILVANGRRLIILSLVKYFLLNEPQWGGKTLMSMKSQKLWQPC